jgi:RNA polymerase sigma-70 factor (ECF subfamily)
LSGGFNTTQWSRVLRARDGADSEARDSLAALCQTYWYPLYAFVRRQGHDPDAARDLTQAYFTELLEKDFLKSVEPSAGRFRSFLLASLKHFLSHERDRERALKRGGGAQIISLDTEDAEARLGGETADLLTPEEIFERQWALTVLERALERLRKDSIESDSEARFEVLKGYLTGEAGRAPYSEAAEKLGTTEGAVRTAVHRLRKRFGRMLRTEISDTVADPADAADEIRHLLSVIQP